MATVWPVLNHYIVMILIDKCTVCVFPTPYREGLHLEEQEEEEEEDDRR